MIFAKEYCNLDQIMDEEDEMILNETIMNVSYNNSAKKQGDQLANAKKEEWVKFVWTLKKISKTHLSDFLLI